MELHQIIERQLEFIAIENLQHQHVVPTELQASQPIVEAVQIGEQIGDDHDQPTLLELAGQSLQHSAQFGLIIRPGVFRR